MKNLIMTMICLGVSVTALAQFNTIARSSSLYKVKRVEQKLPKDSVVHQASNDSTPPATIVTDDVQKAVSTQDSGVGCGECGLDEDGFIPSIPERGLSAKPYQSDFTVWDAQTSCDAKMDNARGYRPSREI